MADLKYWEKIPARPTTYKGIQMRSRLEASFAQQLDRWGISWKYEPQCYGDSEGQYLPDFETWDWWLPYIDGNFAGQPGGRMRQSLFFEVKPEAIAWEQEGNIWGDLSTVRSSLPHAALGISFVGEWFFSDLRSGTTPQATYADRCTECGAVFAVQEWLPICDGYGCPRHRGRPLERLA